MINAKEARQKTESIDSLLNAEELSKCEEAITFAVGKCQFNCYLYVQISDAVKSQLELHGFSVHRDSNSEGSYTLISW